MNLPFLLANYLWRFWAIWEGRFVYTLLSGGVSQTKKRRVCREAVEAVFFLDSMERPSFMVGGCRIYSCTLCLPARRCFLGLSWTLFSETIALEYKNPRSKESGGRASVCSGRFIPPSSGMSKTSCLPYDLDLGLFPFNIS